MDFFSMLKLLILFLTERLSRIQFIHDTFRAIPLGKSIGHYLATTFIHSPNRDNDVLLGILRSRQYGNHNLPMASLGHMEISLLKCRNTFLVQNPTAYNLAWLENPTVTQLEEFARLKQNWSILIAIKAYLIHHPDAAKLYRGFLPYGGPIAAFMSKVLGRTIVASPSLIEHIELMNITNSVAGFLNLTTAEVNTMFYLEGLAILENSGQTIEDDIEPEVTA